ncbi:hypothetical protein FNV43_RR16806 [Rhamnella rubrinervis]|uniref:E2 ubiquitin-conjugating enzyme n=1 Tax=Rhamnella rubrinervis TaxID=2594499 RepID=A0A8K0GZK3_9ROSA|nr:hypothetical protein FNV43_RR16806 [Rhamnella rubrinervis]
MSSSRSMEPPPPIPNSISQISKKRLASGRTSRFMDSEVLEIPTPISRTPKILRNKEVILHDVIEIDDDEDCDDVMLIDERVDRNRKGKAIKTDSNGYNDQEAIINNLFLTSGGEAPGTVDGIESSKSSAPSSHNFINLDSQSSDLNYDDDDYIDLFSDDFMDVDEYAILQAHFDNVDIPPGIEAPIPWFPETLQIKKKPVTGSSSVCTRSQMQSGVGLHGINSSSSSWSSELGHFSRKSIPLSNSSFIQMDVTSHPPGADMSSPLVVPQFSQSKKKPAALQHRGVASNLPLGVESSKSLLKPFQCKKKPVSSSSTNYNSVHQLDAMKLHSEVEPSFWGSIVPNSVNKQVSAGSFYASSFPVHTDTSNHPPGLKPPPYWLQEPYKSNIKPGLVNHTAYSSYHDPLTYVYNPQVANMPWVMDYAQTQKDAGTVGGPTNTVQAFSSMDGDEILRKFQLFKKFDTVQDHSDHHYTRKGFSTQQPTKNWVKRIHEEWKILEKDLPDTIFVRVYESRMDLLRAVIVGAEGTPYHDGLFFFDVFFPSGYPTSPPQVHYHSGGLRLNPNLYNCGKVCLSLLNTWSGSKNEKWQPGKSTMLQVLVSIQGLILNQKPYFNEPGFASMKGSAAGEVQSQQYNESTLILSLKTMGYSIRRPPKYFEDFVRGHFFNRANDIMVACKAYLNGAQVGSLVKGGVQDVDEGDKSCSKYFKDTLAGVLQMLVADFIQIGVKD